MLQLDHTNYARWVLVPVHIQDMVNLCKTHPEFAAAVHKTRHAFSSMAADQAHKENNATVKSDGGAVGLTKTPNAVSPWMVAGPDLVRITTEFEASIIKGMQKRTTSEIWQHELTKSSQEIVAQHVKSLVKVKEEMGNLFL